MQVSAEQLNSIGQLADGTRSMREIAGLVGVSPWYVREHVRKTPGLRFSGNRPMVKTKPKQMRVKRAKADPTKQAVDLFGLVDGKTCRWPLGGVYDPVELFCGCKPKAKSSYCEHHAEIAYEAVKFKVRRPMFV